MDKNNLHFQNRQMYDQPQTGKYPLLANQAPENAGKPLTKSQQDSNHTKSSALNVASRAASTMTAPSVHSRGF